MSRETHAVARKLAEMRGESLSQALHRAVQEEARREMRRQLSDSAARLKADPGAWAAYQADLDDASGTVADGMADDEWEAEWKHRDAITW